LPVEDKLAGVGLFFIQLRQTGASLTVVIPDKLKVSAIAIRR